MGRLARLFLVLGLIAVGGLVLIGGVAWLWWDRNANELIESAKVVAAEGQKTGRNLQEGGCVGLALERHKSDPSMVATIQNGLWLTGCLETSRPQKSFCESVPPQDNPVVSGVWAGSACAQYGFSDPYCHMLFQNVSKYCYSPGRADKVKTGATPGRAT
jgi:hypothetical protein